MIPGRIAVLPLLALVVACEESRTPERFIALAQNVAAYPSDCGQVRIDRAFVGGGESWIKGEEYEVKISPTCEQKWQAALRGRQDFSVLNPDKSDRPIYDNGILRKEGRVSVGFWGQGTVKFAWRNLR
jgi:hypothetical protein